MNRKELDKLIRDYVDAPSDEKERVFKSVFGVCLDLMSRTVGEIKSSELEVDNYNKRLFDTFFCVYDICEGMTDIEIDSVDTGSYNVILKILPSGRLLSIDKDWLCDEYVKGRMKDLTDSIKENYQRDFDFAKKQYDDAASKLLKAKTLDMRIEL
jgi:hypothetical protein